MAGTIIADTLTHSTAGSVTTDYVVNGSANMWVNFNGTGTIATRDSHNVSSMTDEGTGRYEVNINSNMSDGNYGLSTSCIEVAEQGALAYISNNQLPTSSVVEIEYVQAEIALWDAAYICATAHGDLA